MKMEIKKKYNTTHILGPHDAKPKKKNSKHIRILYFILIKLFTFTKKTVSKII